MKGGERLPPDEKQPTPTHGLLQQEGYRSCFAGPSINPHYKDSDSSTFNSNYVYITQLCNKILVYSIPFHFILFCSVLCGCFRFCSIQLCSAMLCSVPLRSIPFHSIKYSNQTKKKEQLPCLSINIRVIEL